MNDRCVVNYEILDKKSKGKAGTLLSETNEYFEFSTIDYDVLLYKDRQSDVLCSIKEGDICRFEKLFNCLPSLEDRTKESWSMLMVATFNGRLDILKKFNIVGCGYKRCEL